MFKLFKTVKEVNRFISPPKPPLPPELPLKEFEIQDEYVMTIMFKSGRTKEFYITSEIFPYAYRKVLNWFTNRNSDNYSFVYKNGVVAIKREDLEYVNVFKRDIKIFK